jgi:outer membrane protein assembly factor BamB
MPLRILLIAILVLARYWYAGPTVFAAEGPAAARRLASPELPPDLGTRHTGQDWPTFLGTGGDSKSAERGILTAWGKNSPPIVWQHRLGTGYGMPSISRGRLFQFSRFANQARLECLNSETGEPLWKFEYPTDYEDQYGYDNGPRCSPVVDDDRVYLFGAEGMLHCLRAVDGAVVWKIDTMAKFGVVQNFFGVGSTPVIFQDLLICQIGGSTDDTRETPPGQLDRVRGKDSGVVAFDKYTGAIRYQTSDELASYAGPTLANINGRDWCFVFARGGLLGFEPSTGKIDFHFPWRAPILESVNASNPIVVDDLVLISETYGPGCAVLKVRPGGYDVVWSDKDQRRDKRLQTHWNTPVHFDGYVYGSSGRHPQNAELRCVELKTGKVMWSQPDLSRSSLLYVDGHFVLLSEGGDLLLVKVNPEKFEPVAIAQLAAAGDEAAPGEAPRKLLTYPAWAAPILSHGLLYVRDHNRLVCLELIKK